MTEYESMRITAQLNACCEVLRSLRALDAIGGSSHDCANLRMRADFQYAALKVLRDVQPMADPNVGEWAWLLRGDGSGR